MPEPRLKSAETPSVEDGFRSVIEDVVRVLEEFKDLASPDDLIGMLKLAIKNDGQLALLMEKMKKE